MGSASAPSVVPAPWVADYIAQYARTTGHAMTVSAPGAGGWYTVTTEHCGVQRLGPSASRMRKVDILAATERLRQRPDHGPAQRRPRP